MNGPLLPRNLRPPTHKGFIWQSLQMVSRRWLPVVQPTFFIVGAQKCGTTSLADYLTTYEQVKPPRFKELRFFNLDYHYDKGIPYYLSLFPARLRGGSRPLHSFDATPEYLYHRKAAGRIREAFPEAKIVVLLREPVARAFSGWNMFCDYRRRDKIHPLFRFPENAEQRMVRELYFRESAPSFSEVVDIELQMIEDGDACYEPSVIRRGLYAEQIKRFFDKFGRARVFVESLKAFRQEPGKTLGRLCHFLGLDYDPSKGHLPVSHARQYTETISERDRDRLNEFYEIPNQELMTLLGRTLDW